MELEIERSMDHRHRATDPQKKTYKAGERYAEFAIKHDNCMAQIGENGLSLFLLLLNPTTEEIIELGSGNSAKLYFTEFSGIGCLMAKFGRMMFDFAVHPKLISFVSQGQLRQCLRNNSLPLYVLIFDASTGMLIRIRECYILSGFSVAFIDWLESKFESELTIAEIQRLYHSYCSEFSTDEIIEQSLFSGTIK